MARRIARVRAESGLNQGDFAERLGFPKRSYLGWERAESAPPARLLSAIRRVFGIDPDWVLHGPEEAPRLHVSQFDWERLQRVQEDIREYASRIGFEPTSIQLLTLAQGVFEEGPAEEANALEQTKKALKAMMRGTL